jgi:hypothetical protein
MEIRLLGPVTILRVIEPAEPRKFLVVAYDGSCNVAIDIDEPWMTDEAIGSRLAEREGLDLLISSCARYILSGGHLERS